MEIDGLQYKGVKTVADKYSGQFGLYLWLTEDKKLVANDNGDFLNIPSVYGDHKKIAALRKAAKECGVDGGGPIFFPGHRRVTQDEWEHQHERLDAGLIPDDHDLPAIIEEASAQKWMK